MCLAVTSKLYFQISCFELQQQFVKQSVLNYFTVLLNQIFYKKYIELKIHFTIR